MQKILCFVCITLFIIKCNAQNNINDFRGKSEIQTSLKQFKKKSKIKGLAFSLFNENNIILSECLGKSTYGFPIDNETLFSIQSVSKNITAFATMIAVQKGLLKLDVPISTYLTNFNINSCFDENPAEKITIRMLLSHTSGMTHEAPRGNNYDFTNCSYKEHIESIADTWIKFPPGTNYSYSNLGMDITALIIEKVSGKDFNTFITENIFNPSGMNSTTIDDKIIVGTKNKTEGYIPAVKSKHFLIPLIGSGAIYTNLNDLTKYVQIHLNTGKNENTRIIENEYLNEMYKINFNNYGLGTYIDKSFDSYYLNHNGGGYGYSSTMLWFPEFKIGAVLLCNGYCSTFSICENIIHNYIVSNNIKKEQNISSFFKGLNSYYFNNKDSINNHKMRYCSNDTIYKSEWNVYTGKYKLLYKGVKPKWYAKLALSIGWYPDIAEIYEQNNVLKLKTNRGISNLREYKKGLFFTNDGELINFNSDIPTYRNIKMKKK